jgi:putative DNA primase/helicase
VCDDCLEILWRVPETEHYVCEKCEPELYATLLADVQSRSPEKVDAEEMNDFGNARRLAAWFGWKLRYVPREDEWRMFDGASWRTVNPTEVTTLTMDVISRTFSEEFHERFPSQPKDPEKERQLLDRLEENHPHKHTKEGREFLAERRRHFEQTGRILLTLTPIPEEAEPFLDWTEAQKSLRHARDAVNTARSLPELVANPEDFDAVPGTFTVANGVIDTWTLRFRPHLAADLCTRMSPVEYRRSAIAERWLDFLDTNIPDDETRWYLQKLVGYALTGESDQKLIVFLYSKVGDTGKSLFLEVVSALFGDDYALSLAKGALAPRKHGDDGRDPDRHAIRGKRFVVASEFRPREPMDEAFVKQLTGGDRVSTRGNYATGNTTWRPELLPIIATNHLSRINAEDEAIWNRIAVVPFTVSFPKGHPDRDETLREKVIREELPGVLNWALEGLDGYRREGLAPPAEVVNASLAYRTDADSVTRLIADAAEEGYIDVQEDATASLADLYKLFANIARNEGVPFDLGKSAFKERLTELGYEYRRATSGTHKGKHRVCGIGLAQWVPAL